MTYDHHYLHFTYIIIRTLCSIVKIIWRRRDLCNMQNIPFSHFIIKLMPARASIIKLPTIYGILDLHHKIVLVLQIIYLSYIIHNVISSSQAYNKHMDARKHLLRKKSVIILHSFEENMLDYMYFSYWPVNCKHNRRDNVVDFIMPLPSTIKNQ